MDNNETVEDYMIRLKVKSGLSFSDISKKVGISRVAATYIIYDDKTPTCDNLQKILTILNGDISTYWQLKYK